MGRFADQMAAYLRLTRPGGLVVIEDVNPDSWQFVPPGPALSEVVRLVKSVFGNLGLSEPSTVQLDMFRQAGVACNVRTEVIALPPGHPYQWLPLQFVEGLRRPLQSLIRSDDLATLEREAERELHDSERWGLTFTLVQTWGTP